MNFPRETIVERKHSIMDKETVLITGASGGIGKEFAKIFASHGFNLVLVSRNEEKLRSLADELTEKYHITVRVFAADLSEPDGADKVYAFVKENNIKIDQLVNNAGAGKKGRVVDTDPETLRGLINLNAASVAVLCRLIGSDMIKAGRGKILNVSSLGAFIPDPYFNVYGPTKAFELFLTQAMHGELKGTGVSVSVLCPGPVKTGWAKNAGKADSKMAKDPAVIARIGYNGMQRGKLIIVPTFLYKAERFGMGFLPVRARISLIRTWQKKLIAEGR